MTFDPETVFCYSVNSAEYVLESSTDPNGLSKQISNT